VVETSLLVFTPLVQTSLSDSIIKSAQEPEKPAMSLSICSTGITTPGGDADTSERHDTHQTHPSHDRRHRCHANHCFPGSYVRRMGDRRGEGRVSPRMPARHQSSRHDRPDAWPKLRIAMASFRLVFRMAYTQMYTLTTIGRVETCSPHQSPRRPRRSHTSPTTRSRTPRPPRRYPRLRARQARR